MFVRFRQSRARLQVSLAESRREAGKVRLAHIAGLGSIAEPMTIASRLAFWTGLRERLDKLANRVGDGQVKVLDAIHARIPMVTLDEMRALQRENAEDDAKFWDALANMNAEHAEGLKGHSGMALRKASEAEAAAKEAASNAARAKDRLDKLAKGESVVGGLHKPMTAEDVCRLAGWTPTDIREAMAMSRLDKSAHEALLRDQLAAMLRAEKAVRRRLLRGASGGWASSASPTARRMFRS